MKLKRLTLSASAFLAGVLARGMRHNVIALLLWVSWRWSAPWLLSEQSLAVTDPSFLQVLGAYLLLYALWNLCILPAVRELRGAWAGR